MKQKEKLKEYSAFKLTLFGANNNCLIIGKPPGQNSVRLWDITDGGGSFGYYLSPPLCFLELKE